MVYRVGYICIRKISISLQRQKEILLAAGISDDLIWIDKNGKRKQRDWMIEKAVCEGGILVIASPEILGVSTRDRAKVLRALARQNAQVQIADGEPVLYDTQAKIDEFTKSAGKAALRATGRAVARKAPGRPPKYKLTDDQWNTICTMWTDNEIAPTTTMKHAAIIAGEPVSRNAIRRKCGERGTRSK